jgi:prepilin-type N-terminal cleavage/methylation domain-containing protein
LDGDPARGIAHKGRMRKGFTLLELMVVICVAAVLVGLWTPRAARLLDWIETERAVRDVTTALAVGRNGAVLQAIRARVTFATDSIRIDRFVSNGWEPWWRIPGPASHGVELEVSNPIVVFGPTGMGWGASNTKIVLRRGSQAETITVSRVGRVKHW